MNYLAWLVPIALGMGAAGLAAFLWSMRNGQYDDLDGAAERVLLHDTADAPLWDGVGSRNRSGNARSAHPDDEKRTS